MVVRELCERGMTGIVRAESGLRGRGDECEGRQSRNASALHCMRFCGTSAHSVPILGQPKEVGTERIAGTAELSARVRVDLG